MFSAVLRVSQTQEDQEIVQLESSIKVLRRVIDIPAGQQITSSDATAAATATRTVYMAVSTARDPLKEKSFLAPGII